MSDNLHVQSPYLTPSEADRYVRRRNGTVQKTIKAGRLKPRQFDGEGQPLVHTDDLDRLMIPVGVLELAKDAA